MTILATITEVATDTGAVAAITSPLWLASLHEVSAVAALILPILGAIWLAVQIISKVFPLLRPPRR